MKQQSQQNHSISSPFLLNGALPMGRVPLLGRSIESIVEDITGLTRMHQAYQDLPSAGSSREFLEIVFDLLQIRYRVHEGNTSNIPEKGGAIVIANHPFGALEGMILAHILLGIRNDVRILANEFLGRIPELKELFFGVDVFEGKQSRSRNVGPLRKAVSWVRDGGLLLVFPAGEVSHFQPSQRSITDPQWNDTIGRMVRLTQAPVTPVYFHGKNSVWFQTLGLLRPWLRTVMLPRQFLNKQNSIIDLRIGKSIAFQKLKQFDNDRQLTEYLRFRTYTLKTHPKPEPLNQKTRHKSATTRMDTIAKPVNYRLLAAEVENLPGDQRLTENGELKVYYAEADQIPWILLEIGRLRETAFRLTGEGTGKSVDLDQFDNHYLHLFVWNETTREVVCAYRMGLSDQIVDEYGLKGLYSYSLFKYERRFLDSINPSIELGRSFVRPEYQRNFSPLMLLWKGIGHFVAQKPRYRVLFGPVTISNDYETVSQQLLVDFLKMNNYDPALARYVKPRKPFKKAGKCHWKRSDFTLLQDIDHVSELVSQFERDDKGVPILLKQYLKLGGTILGFNVDDQFSDALDGLIMVDLVQTDPKVLRRYMGQQQSNKFLDYHRPNYSQVS
ncbi:MAG: GNAT family N-acyltransferase [Gammaproteobacteria bacterium]|jgi:putative hemolysin